MGSKCQNLAKTMLRRFDLSAKGLVKNNVIVTNFSGKSLNSMGMIVLKVTIGSYTRATIFVVV